MGTQSGHCPVPGLRTGCGDWDAVPYKPSSSSKPAGPQQGTEGAEGRPILRSFRDSAVTGPGVKVAWVPEALCATSWGVSGRPGPGSWGRPADRRARRVARAQCEGSALETPWRRRVGGSAGPGVRTPGVTAALRAVHREGGGKTVA